MLRVITAYPLGPCVWSRQASKKLVTLLLGLADYWTIDYGMLLLFGKGFVLLWHF
jgi:hypothetical protein